jgi:hypothetical protein
VHLILREMLDQLQIEEQLFRTLGLALGDDSVLHDFMVAQLLVLRIGQCRSNLASENQIYTSSILIPS